jgi:hypothetical protein
MGGSTARLTTPGQGLPACLPDRALRLGGHLMRTIALPGCVRAVGGTVQSVGCTVR